MSERIQRTDMKPVVNEVFLKKAENLKPNLFRKKREPLSLVELCVDQEALHGVKVCGKKPFDEDELRGLIQGEQRILDFGCHVTGYVRLRIRTEGSPQDAPVKMRVAFGEVPGEVFYPFSEYKGWLSNSWLQEEVLFADETPMVFELQRRYSFRYMELEILGISEKFTVSVDQISCCCVTSADPARVPKLKAEPELERIDEISVRTLQECMQEVFEDGPKRDRRLWLGDLRLQALVNEVTVQQYDIVKRCLYLFAGAVREDGMISACIFTKPRIVPDDTFLFEYSLLFVVVLCEYYEASKDRETLEELWESAYRQIELACRRLEENDIVVDDPSWWAFIDWNDELNKQAPAQGAFLYCIKKGVRIAQILEDKRLEELEALERRLKHASLSVLWDEKHQFFVSGANHQISWASQIWMVLGGVLSMEEGKQLLKRMETVNPMVRMVSPYMYHYYIEALIMTGQQEHAKEKLKEFWGGMVRMGADTFWEVYDPEEPGFSPYGSCMITSYCHAWSCTPAYFIRKYFAE